MTHFSAPLGPRDLKVRFRYMFDGPNDGFDFHRGWMPITSRACEEIDAVLSADKRNFRWTRIKEKFGGARFYYWIDRLPATRGDEGSADVKNFSVGRRLTDSVNGAIAAIVTNATVDTESACMICGASAQRHSYGGYVVTLCELHQFRGAIDDPWYDAVVRSRLKIDDV